MNNALNINYFLGRLLSAPLGTPSNELVLKFFRNVESWEPVIEAASENLITPALHTSFIYLKLFHDLPEDLKEYLTEIHRCNAYRNREIKLEVLQITSLLNRAGIEPLFLKGVANLFFDIYPDPADRIMHDADILIPKARLPESVLILKKSGYYSPYDESSFNKRSHHYLPLISGSGQTIVELHQYTTPTRYSLLYSDDDFWASSLVKTVENARFRLPSPMNHIQHHIIHSYKHFGIFHMGHFFLRGLYDFALLCRKFEDQIEWSRLEAVFQQAGFRKALVSYLLACEQFCCYQEPLRHVQIQNPERLYFSYMTDLYLKHPTLFALMKLFSQYRQAASEIATDRESRKEFLKKLKNLSFYVRQIQKIRQNR